MPLFQIYHDTEIDIWEFGAIITTICVIVMIAHAAIEMRSWVSKP